MEMAMSAGFSDLDPGRTREESAPLAGRDEVDLGGVSAALGRHKGLILGTTAVAALAALGFCLVVKPRYLAEARVIVEDQESYFTRSDPTARDMPQPPDAEAINSQMQLVSSRDLARKAVAALHLQTNPEFDPSAPGLLAPLAMLGIGDGGPKAAEDRLLTTYFDHLTVLSPTKSRILQIEFYARDPDLAAEAANRIADLYIELKQQAKRDNARQAAQSLQPQIADLEKRVADADARVTEFRVSNGLYESAENTNLSTQQLGEIATRLADARAAQSEAAAKARALRDLLSRGRLGDAGEISSDDLVRGVAARRSMIQAQLAAESRTLLPGHPRIKELQAQLSDIETQLRAAVDKAARGLDNNARVASARVANLASLLDEQKKVVGVANGQQAQVLELQRQAKTLKDQLESESAKYQAAMAREKSDSTPADARVVSRALAPSLPVFPKKVPITLFAALAGLFFTSFTVIAREVSGRGSAPAPTPAPPAPSAGETDSGPKWFGAPARGGVLSGVGAQASAALGKVKSAVAHFGAPAVPLDDHAPVAPAETTPAERRLAESDAPRKTPDIWVRDPFATLGPAPKAAGVVDGQVVDGQVFDAQVGNARVGHAQVGNAQIQDEPAPPAPKIAPQVSSELVDRIVAAGDGQGVIALLVEADAATTPPHSLVAARALARMGRAILVQAGLGHHLDTVMAGRDGDQNHPEPNQPGVAQLLAGEASFAEAIFRDGASRLHLLSQGGPLEADAEDLRTVIDALRATYDFVLIAVEADTLGLELAQEADLTLIVGAPSRRRDDLHDAFVGAGVRQLILAAPTTSGELTEGAA
jgi:uncharacterized protein involved in exopolysaccharide biosynthesis